MDAEDLQSSAGLSSDRFVKSLEARMVTGGMCYLLDCHMFLWE